MAAGILLLLLGMAAPAAHAGPQSVCMDAGVPLTPAELRELAACMKNAVARANPSQDAVTMRDCMREKIIALRGCGVGDMSEACNAAQSAQSCTAPAMPAASQQQSSEECHRAILARRMQRCDSVSDEVPACQQVYRNDKAKCDKEYSDKVQVSRDEEVSNEFLTQANEEYEHCVQRVQNEYQGCIAHTP